MSAGTALERASKIFVLLKQAAAEGLECPSNAVLAERAGAKSPSSAADAVTFLETAGMIRVEREANFRVVTICASGKRTAERVLLKERRGEKSRAEYLAEQDAIVRPRMEYLAEQISRGCSLRSCAKAMGVGVSTAELYWKKIKAELGWQAA